MTDHADRRGWATDTTTTRTVSSGLTITRLETVPIIVPLAREFRGSYYRMTHRATLIVRLHTADGIVGEAYVGDEDRTLRDIEAIVQREIAPRVVGQVMDTNVGGAFHMLQAVGRIMLQKGSGAIVNISSISGERGSPGRGAYSASKAALVGLTRTAAVEWAQRGVRVNAVAPGYVDTPFLRSAVESGRLALDDILARIPMRALTPVSQVAEAVLFLASERAAFITGQVLAVDGGFLADFGVAAHGS